MMVLRPSLVVLLLLAPPLSTHAWPSRNGEAFIGTPACVTVARHGDRGWLQRRTRRATTIPSSTTSSTSSGDAVDIDIDDETDLDAKLERIYRALKLEVYDIDEGDFRLDSKDNKYGIEVVKTSVKMEGGLGLVLTEVAGGTSDGRGLVLVTEVAGNAASADPPVLVGDVITGVMTSDHRTARERTVGLNYDRTVEAIGDVKRVAAEIDGILILEINRLVKRAPIEVQVEVDGSSEVRTIEALAGENLRRLLLR